MLIFVLTEIEHLPSNIAHISKLWPTEQNQPTYVLQSLKYLLSWRSQKKFADPGLTGPPLCFGNKTNI